MILFGEWAETDDGRVLPIIRGKVLTAGDIYCEAFFLVDSGADCTVFTAQELKKLGYQAAPNLASISGVGGIASTGTIETTIILKRENGSDVRMPGHYTVELGPSHLDMNVLGRDILHHFTLILDRPGRIVALVAPNHRYRIEEI
jgi:hypothetical protein